LCVLCWVVGWVVGGGVVGGGVHSQNKPAVGLQPGGPLILGMHLSWGFILC